MEMEMEIEVDYDEMIRQGEEAMLMYNEEQWDKYVEFEPVLQKEVVEPVLSKIERICKELEEEMNRFIQEKELALFFKPSELEKKKSLVLEWLRNEKTRYGRVYRIDCNVSTHMLRQLLTHPVCPPDTMLRASTNHISINSHSSPKKQNLRITCDEVSVNAVALRHRLKYNPESFTDAEEYRILINRFGQYSSTPVHVCQVWSATGSVLCVSVLEREGFDRVEGIILCRKLEAQHVKNLQQEYQIASIASKKSESITGIIGKMMGVYLSSLDTTLVYEEERVRNDNVINFLAKRTYLMTNFDQGKDASLSAIEECITRLGSYANAMTEEKGLEWFSGKITLEIDEIPLVNFEKQREPLWRSHITTLMNNPIEKRWIKAHRKEKLSEIHTLVIKFGGEEVARTIIPFMTGLSCLVNNGTIIVNNTVNVNISEDGTKPPDPPSNKRKRTPKQSPFIEKIKRIRLASDDTVGDDPTQVFYKMIITKLPCAPETNPIRRCIVCEIEKPYTSFYQKSTISGHTYYKERNICHGCLTAHTKWRKQTTQ